MLLPSSGCGDVMMYKGFGRFCYLYLQDRVM